MGKSQRLRVGEVRAAVRLAGECRELGHDPLVWPAHLLAGMPRLTGSHMLVAGEMVFVGARPVQIPSAHVGWPDGLTGEYLPNWVRDGGEPDNPAMVAFTARPGPRGTATRQELASDREWNASAHVNEVLRPFGLDEGMVSSVPLPGGRDHMLVCGRAVGEKAFGPRERDVVSLLHAELAPHLGRALATSDDPAAGLTPRLRQVWLELLGGDPEKWIARRLGVSPHTLHWHVKKVYKAFAAGSRAELMARCLRRRPPPGDPPPG